MAEYSQNLWAPWRMEYIEALSDSVGGCFLCRYKQNSAADPQNHVLWRTPRTLVLLNRFPYTNGHLLVAPAEHIASPEALPDDVLCELSRRICEAKRVLDDCLAAQGYNIGMNLGRCAGAGLPDHLHWHIVPRWNGDTNFVPILSDARVMPQSLERTQQRFLESAAKLGLGGG